MVKERTARPLKSEIRFLSRYSLRGLQRLGWLWFANISLDSNADIVATYLRVAAWLQGNRRLFQMYGNTSIEIWLCPF